MEGPPELNRSLEKQLTKGGTIINSGEEEKTTSKLTALAIIGYSRSALVTAKIEAKKKIHMGQRLIEATFDWRIGPGGGIESFTQQFQSWSLRIGSRGVN